MYRSATIDGAATTAFAFAGTLFAASHQNVTRTARPAGTTWSTWPTLMPRIRTSDPGYTLTVRGKYAVACTRFGSGQAATAATARMARTTPTESIRLIGPNLRGITDHLPWAGRESRLSATGSPGRGRCSARRCRTTARCP